MNKIIRISGGIGNQLFQYAFGLYLSKEYLYNIKYDVQTNQNLSFFTNRKPLIYDLINHLETTNKPIYENSLFYRIKRKFVKDFCPSFSELYVENINNRVIDNNSLIRKLYFDGYWQSSVYINKIENILRENIIFPDKLLNECQNNLLLIKNTKSCSIHVRRGDYLSKKNSKLFNTCTMSYYNSCINYLNNIDENIVYYIFSDDLNWARENFKGSNIFFLENNNNNPLVDLFLISNCNHNIISNSTFSWWGAWLNSFNNKIVLSPKTWYKNSITNNSVINNLIPSNWILISE